MGNRFGNGVTMAGGISASGQAHHRAGWPGVVALVACFLLVPFAAGIPETRAERGG